MVERPSVNVFEDFRTQQAVPTPEMPTVIIGPRQDFLDYNLPDDKVSAYAGPYEGAEIEFLYPEKYILSDILQDKVKVTLDEARIKYFEKSAGADDYEFRAIKRARNRITTVADLDTQRLSFQEYTNKAGAIFPRSVEFDDRDVKVGDIVKVFADIGLIQYETLSDIIGVVNDIIPAVIGVPSAADLNQEAQSHSIVAEVDTGASGDTIVAAGTYVGDLKDDVIEDLYTITVTTQGGPPTINAPVKIVDLGGNTATSGGSFDSATTDTYTIEVTQGGLPGSGAGNAKLQVTSLNGDDQAEVDFTAFATGIAIGIRGITITIADDGSVPGELVAGDIWQIQVIASVARMSVYSESQTDDVASRAFPGFGVALPIATRGAMMTITDEGDGKIVAGDVFKIRCKKEVAVTVAFSSGDYDHTKDLIYTIEVIQGGVWGECQISITSTGIDASGPYIVNVAATDVPAGTKGALIQFATNVHGGLKKGDRWTIQADSEKNGAVKTIVLSQNIHSEILNAVPPTTALTKTAGAGDNVAVMSGVYNDDIVGALSKHPTEKYTIICTETGDPVADTPKFTVTSSSGLDDQVEVEVTAYGTEYTIGIAGLKITWTFGTTHFILGDTWEVIVSGINLNTEFMIKRNDFELPRYREDAGFDTAWELDHEKVTIEANINVADSEWKSGAEFLPLVYAKAYVTYEAIRTDVIGEILSLDDRDKIVDEVGRIHISNPLAYGIDKAMENSLGETTYYYPVVSNDVTGHMAFLKLAENVKFTYNMVPLTFSADIRAIYEEHNNKFSLPEHNKWRRGFYCTERIEKFFLFDVWHKPNSTDDENFMATVTDYVETSVTDYLFVEAETDGNVNFIQDNIKEGDFFRTLFKINNQGVLEWSDFEIAGVVSETTLVLKVGPDSSITTPEKFQIYRILDADGMVEKLAAVTNSIEDRRVVMVYPDYITDEDDYLVPGYYICAAVAGMVSVTPPHQGLTNYKIKGFKDASRSYVDLAQEDLDKLADAGFMIITQDAKDAPLYVRHQLTTDVRYTEFRELSIGVNVDNIAFFFKEMLEPYLGIYNINDDTMDYIRTRVEAGIEDLKSVTDPIAGPQIIDAQIIRLYQLPPPNKTSLRLDILLTIPYPLNVINVHLII